MRMPGPSPKHPTPRREHSVPRRVNRKNSNWGLSAATAAIAVVIFGFLIFMMSRSPAATDSASGAVPGTTTPARTVATAPAATQQQEGAVKRETRPATDATVRVAAKSALERTASQTAAGRAKLVQAQIAAGEFGPALQTAKSATDAVERTQLLKTIANVQKKTGNWQAADVSISRIPVPESRDQARAQNASRPTAAGGAAQAAMLVNLLKNTTGDENDWADEEGLRKTPIYWPPGIEVDPNGLLRGLTHQETGNALSSLGHRARDAALNTNLRAASSLRLVSLTRLEKEVAKRLAEGRDIPET